jgi:hypothetical protein
MDTTALLPRDRTDRGDSMRPTTVTLLPGRPLTVRPSTPSDHALLADYFATLGRELVNRFPADTADTPPWLTGAELDRLVGEQLESPGVLILCGGELLAEGFLEEPPVECAAALVSYSVAPEWREHGAAAPLLWLLTKLARERRLYALSLAVDDADEPMIDALRVLGATREEDDAPSEAAGLTESRYELPLPIPAAVAAGHEARCELRSRATALAEPSALDGGSAPVTARAAVAMLGAIQSMLEEPEGPMLSRLFELHVALTGALRMWLADSSGSPTDALSSAPELQDGKRSVPTWRCSRTRATALTG